MYRVLVALILAGCTLGGAAEPGPAEPVTKLSPYEVRANTVDFKSWIKVGSPNFVVYTDASGTEATRVLHEMEMLQFAIQVVFGRKASQLGPTIIVLPTASSDWRKLESKGGTVEWKSAAAEVGGDITDILVIQYDWQEEGLGLVRAIYSGIAMQRMEITGPLWFQRGFGHFLETASFDGEKVVLGQLGSQAAELQTQWLPWDRFFNVTPSAPEFIKERTITLYEAQAAIFTQFLFVNKDRAWIGRLAQWLDYLRTGAEPTEAKFTAVFRQDWKTWQRTMQDYLEGGRHNLFQLRVPQDVTQYQATSLKLPVKEVRELFVLAQILVQHVPESQASLDALLATGLRSEPLREMFTSACLRWGRRDAALESIRRLIADGSTNARVYRMGDELLTSDAGPFSVNLRYGPELAEVREWDRRGVELEPLYSDLNNSFAGNEACAAVVDQQSITTIEECYARLKGRAPTERAIAALALALWRIGDRQTAGELAGRLEADPLISKSIRTFAAQLLQAMKIGPSVEPQPTPKP
jgi:hypothetical protein